MARAGDACRRVSVRTRWCRETLVELLREITRAFGWGDSAPVCVRAFGPWTSRARLAFGAFAQAVLFRRRPLSSLLHAAVQVAAADCSWLSRPM